MRRHLRELVGREHRPVDADARIAAPGQRRHAPEAGAEAACHPGLERQLRRDAQGAYRLEHRRRAAGEQLDIGEIAGQEVRDQSAVAGEPSSVATVGTVPGVALNSAAASAWWAS